MRKKIILNKSIVTLFVLLIMSTLATGYQNIIHQKNLVRFLDNDKDTLDWAFFQPERTYYEIDKLISQPNPLKNINLENINVYFDIFIGSYSNLNGINFSTLLDYDCEKCKDKDYLSKMKPAYIELGEIINKVNALSKNGWTKDTLKYLIINNNHILEITGQLALLSNQKLAVYNGEKQQEILHAEQLMLKLFILQIFCFILFSLFSFYQLYKLNKTKQKLEISNDKITSSREEIIKAYQSRTQLLGRLAHEIRTPLNAILGFAQVMNDDLDNKLNKEQQSNIDIIITSSTLVTNLVEQILDFSRLESGNVDLRYLNFDFYESLKEVETILQNDLKNNNIIIKYIKKSAIIFADPLKTKQIIMNLLTNAIKYGNKNDIIVIDTVDENNNTIVFSIKNNGIVIPISQQTDLFTEFYRAQYSDSKINGYGIGLSLCKKICELMNGEITFKSESNETTFFVKLPKGEIEKKSNIKYLNEEKIENYENLIIISEYKIDIDNIVSKVENFSKIKYFIVPDILFAKDIIEYSDIKYLIYTDNIMTDEFSKYLKLKHINSVKYENNKITKDSMSILELDDLFIRWFK